MRPIEIVRASSLVGKKSLVALGLFVLLALPSRRARACGASAAGSGVSSCSVDFAEYEDRARPHFRAGLGYGVTQTSIKFRGDALEQPLKLRQERIVLLALGEWRPHRRWGLSLGAGSLLHGALWDHSTQYRMNPGFVGAIGANFVALQNDGAVPFVLLSAQLSSVFASTSGASKYSAFDLRLGVQVGWRMADILSAYVATRVFGGPISWTVDDTKVVGTDAYHYQVGFGLSTLVGGGVDVFVEATPIGERGAIFGVGAAF